MCQWVTSAYSVTHYTTLHMNEAIVMDAIVNNVDTECNYVIQCQYQRQAV